MVHEADGVFEGGGVKGLGLVGALEAFADRDQFPDSYLDPTQPGTAPQTGAA